MDTALLIARLLLALVFVMAGVAKLTDLAGSHRHTEGSMRYMDTFTKANPLEIRR